MFTAAAGFSLTTITVETYRGDGARGPDYASPVTRQVYRSDSRQLVRAQNGAEVVSSTSIFDDPEQATLYAPDTRVTLPEGEKSLVIARSINVIGDPDVDHVKVSLA